MQNKQTTGLQTAAKDYVTIAEQACIKVNGFRELYQKLERSLNVTGKSKSTLINYADNWHIWHCISINCLLH